MRAGRGIEEDAGHRVDLGQDAVGVGERRGPGAERGAIEAAPNQRAVGVQGEQRAVDDERATHVAPRGGAGDGARQRWRRHGGVALPPCGPGPVAPASRSTTRCVRMISMPLINGFSTTCRNRMLTWPSLLMLKARIVPMLVPGDAARSMLSTRLTPSMSMSKTRWPGSSVPELLLARYRRTWIGVPAGTSKFHSISGAAGCVPSFAGEQCGRRPIEVVRRHCRVIRADGQCRHRGAAAGVAQRRRRTGVGRPVGTVVGGRERRTAGVHPVQDRRVAAGGPTGLTQQDDVARAARRSGWRARASRCSTGRTPGAAAARWRSDRCRCLPTTQRR